jgi:aminocarboxymuconate-semialdehyde decarboxylase
MFHYDTCVYDAATLDRLASVVGADRIILGGDFPFGDTDSCGEHTCVHNSLRTCV